MITTYDELISKKANVFNNPWLHPSNFVDNVVYHRNETISPGNDFVGTNQLYKMESLKCISICNHTLRLISRHITGKDTLPNLWASAILPNFLIF